ncbi:transporter substrate-binding domain-containing protein [Hutsoniella sourekii]|uniref:transporter substrate-binding domain-containing protein n=1 Tax=Hutsoniella sourekii TaxID=87650 RepID=UPI0004B8AE18|nr:transporter substrate-binding domain-containing protein [Hutsoniella sourekii]
MKKKYYHWAVLALASLSLTACHQSYADLNINDKIQEQAHPTLTWGVKADTNLFGFYSPAAGEITGFEVDLARALTDELTDGQGKAEFVEINSKTRIPMLKLGKIDAIIATMTINEEREGQVDFSDVYFRGGQSLLVKKDSGIEGIDDLTKDHTVIAVKGSSSTKNFRKLKPEVNVLDLENYSEAFVALQSGQGDALTTDNAILLGMMAKDPNYHLAGANFTKEFYGIAINEDQDDFHQAVNQALDTLQANGVYDELYNKWFKDLLPADSIQSASTSTHPKTYYPVQESREMIEAFTQEIRQAIGEAEPGQDK